MTHKRVRTIPTVDRINVKTMWLRYYEGASEFVLGNSEAKNSTSETFLLFTQEVSVSNIYPEIKYPDRGYRDFIQPLTTNSVIAS